MKKDNLVYLKQISEFIVNIEEYAEDLNYNDFEVDYKTQDAIIRKLELIGEAANRLSYEFIDLHPSFPVKQAIAIRNKLIHEYEEVDIKIIWDTIKNDLPIVKSSIENILEIEK